MQDRQRHTIAAILVVCGALTVFAGVPADAAQHRVEASRASTLAKRARDAQRLARAARDIVVAAQAIHDHPGAEDVFGPMLRDAQSRLESGIAAASATTLPAGTFEAAVEASLTGAPGEAPQGLADASRKGSKAPEPRKAASSVGLELRRRLLGITRLWI